MNALGIDYAADLGGMVTDDGQTVLFRGVTVPCAAGAMQTGREVQEDGNWIASRYIRIAIVNSNLPSGAPIKEGEKLRYDGEQIRIASITKQPGITVLTCSGELTE